MDLRIPQIEEAVLQAYVFPCVGGTVDLKGQIVLRDAQDPDLLGFQLDLPRGKVRIVSLFIPADDGSGNADYRFLGQSVELLIRYDDLGDAVMVPQVKKGDASVISDGMDPSASLTCLPTSAMVSSPQFFVR